MRITFLDLQEGLDKVEPGFKPDDMGVVVEAGDLRWHPEWRLVAEMQYSYEPGLPEYWCTDGRRVYFNCPVNKDCRVTVADRPLNE